MTERVSLTVPSHPKYLYVIRSALYPIVIDAGFTRKEAGRIVLAVDEACSNIIKYAYEGDHTKTISVDVDISSGEIEIRLTDSGRRTDVSKISPRRLEDVRPGGLGTHFIGSVFDAVQYDTGRAEGTMLILKRRIPEKG